LKFSPDIDVQSGRRRRRRRRRSITLSTTAQLCSSDLGMVVPLATEPNIIFFKKKGMRIKADGHDLYFGTCKCFEQKVWMRVETCRMIAEALLV
jgi:hypothetical protein